MSVVSESGKPLVFCCWEGEGRSKVAASLNNNQEAIIPGGSKALLEELNTFDSESQKIDFLRTHYSEKKVVLIVFSDSKTFEWETIELQKLLEKASIDYTLILYSDLIRDIVRSEKTRL
jgi:hypothetical protein